MNLHKQTEKAFPTPESFPVAIISGNAFKSFAVPGLYEVLLELLCLYGFVSGKGKKLLTAHLVQPKVRLFAAASLRRYLF